MASTRQYLNRDLASDTIGCFPLCRKVDSRNGWSFLSRQKGFCEKKRGEIDARSNGRSAAEIGA